jgi:4-amino-4-deoxy-L-arabinose transferase-like glycosyltransferase
MKKTYLYTAIISLFCLWIYGAGLFQLPVTDKDEALFAQASKQMIQTGNYGQIKVQDKNRHLKPPGIYWLQSATVKTIDRDHTFHIGFFRLVSAIGAYLSALILFFGLRRFTSEKKAFLSAMLLSSSLLLVGEAHLATTDAMLLCTMVLMQTGLLFVYMKPSKIGPILFWGAMALGTLIKGLTPVVGLLTLATLIIIDRDPKLFFKTKPLKGIMLFVVISLCWLIPISLATHSNFLWDMIHGDLLPKITGGQEGHGRFPGYFLVLLPLIFWPGSLLLGKGIAHSVKQFRDPLTRFLLAWLVPTWMLYEIIPTKLPEYVLPLFPAIAALIVLGYSAKLSKPWKTVEIIVRALWLLYSVALLIALSMLPHYMRQSLTSMQYLTVIALAAMIVISNIHYHKKYLLPALFCVSAIFYPLLTAKYLPELNNFWLSVKINNVINKLPKTNQPVLASDYQEPSLIFYLGTKQVKFMPSSSDVFKQLKKGQLGLTETVTPKSFKNLATLTGFEYNGGHWRTIHVVTPQ